MFILKLMVTKFSQPCVRGMDEYETLPKNQICKFTSFDFNAFIYCMSQMRKSRENARELLPGESIKTPTV